ncbi:hypothetical protein K2173_016265 [Erythroxylum novogranatense]|uniref:Transmembrane protein n=1 Tax=Erythroxylum novogranatense TaxID=1862640 RepID=A0AAV8SGE6_9ROSI|nr:hypothetical protein K2173_016265 [Erythroxylum novogranatense]
MEGLQNFIRNISKETKSGTSDSSILGSRTSVNGHGIAPASSSSDSRILVARSARQTVSLWTCSKLCAVFFVAGVVVGYTLKRRVRSWASKLLRRLKDD